jgi:hypothetical protein
VYADYTHWSESESVLISTLDGLNQHEYEISLKKTNFRLPLTAEQIIDNGTKLLGNIIREHELMSNSERVQLIDKSMLDELEYKNKTDKHSFYRVDYFYYSDTMNFCTTENNRIIEVER